MADTRTAVAVDLVARMRALADELDGPLRCTTPAGGVVPGGHCAACCYGTGYIVTCEADEAAIEAARQLRQAARLIDQAGAGG